MKKLFAIALGVWAAIEVDKKFRETSVLRQILFLVLFVYVAAKASEEIDVDAIKSKIKEIVN